MTAHLPTSSASEDRFCPQLKALVASLRDRKANWPKVVGDEKDACDVLGVGASQLANKRRAGEVASFLSGKKRLYDLGSCFDLLIEQAIASFSPSGEPLRARRPAGMFKPGHRPSKPTTKQREALKRGNAIRIARAQARRAAVST